MQMNSELRHAELELLSAHCATYQLRLRFSMEDLARFGQRDVLRKSVEAANALSEYYTSIEKKIPEGEAVAETVIRLSEEQVLEAVCLVSSYLREQRDRYLPSAVPLSPELKAAMGPYFSPELLDGVRMVQLNGERVPCPAFYAEARALGFANLPEIAHMNSLTFLDVLVFNEKLTGRTLFHALVHAVQFQVLGLERYSELFVRSFVNTKLHFTVPLEAHAFSLEARFSRPEVETFSVEEQVRLWATHGRYEAMARAAHP
ncbi:MAG: hypothetical protein LAO24_20460 [Acidobacteriia bacterium]|nr:hypothetical protein [Terriglobia bacterium]